MQTISNLPQEARQEIARSLGYEGKIEGFPKYLMSNKEVASRYAALEGAFQGQQQFIASSKRSKMAKGGYTMDRFDQNQQQDMVGGYVPPPTQSFANGGIASQNNERGSPQYPSDMEQFPIAEFEPFQTVAQPTSMPALDRRGGAGGYAQLPNIQALARPVYNDFFPSPIPTGNNPSVFATSTNPNIKQE